MTEVPLRVVVAMLGQDRPIRDNTGYRRGILPVVFSVAFAGVAGCIGTVDAVLLTVAGSTPRQEVCELTAIDTESEADLVTVAVEGDFLEAVTRSGFRPPPSVVDVRLTCGNGVVHEALNVGLPRNEPLVFDGAL